jgi:hypothetical protein
MLIYINGNSSIHLDVPRGKNSMTNLDVDVIGNANSGASALTINDVEQKIQSGLEELRRIPFGGAISEALKYLLPEGKRVLVELEKDGRKKRRVIAPNWRPHEAVLYYEDGAISESVDPASVPESYSASPAPSAHLPSISLTDASEVQIGQLCAALADAERAGKSFIALKWFRDEALPAHEYAWADDPESRQTVLAKAIEAGAVVTSRIPNPRAPLHPTTTIKLNGASKYAKSATPRFQPIRARGGASASEIVIRDRGRF